MRSALLKGLVREPSVSVGQQVVTWDQSDVLTQLGGHLDRLGSRVVPDVIRDRLDRGGDETRQALGLTREPGPDFLLPFDPHLMKFCRLSNHLGLSINGSPSQAALDDLSQRTEEAVIALLSKVESPSLIGRRVLGKEAGFRGRTIEQATVHILSKLFSQLEKEFHDLDEAAKEKASHDILVAIEEMDEVTQAGIRERIGVNRLSADAFYKTGAIAGIGTGLGGAVAIGGFGSYTLLTSTIASVAGVVGVTLPFSFYIMATSTLAFLSNPVTIVAALAGGGWFLRRTANRSVRDRYLLVLAALSVIAQGNRTEEEDAARAFADHAKQRYREFLAATGNERRAYERAFPAFHEAKG